MSISLNSHNDERLTDDDLKNNYFNYVQVNGRRVKATRFFVRNKCKLQVKKLSIHYGKEHGYHREVKFDKGIYLKLIKNTTSHFKFEGINLKREQPKETTLKPFKTFEEDFIN